MHATSGRRIGFNGAATFRPRKVAPSSGPRRADGASMGPRPFGRGRQARLPANAGSASFNGAATFRPRKAQIPSRRRAGVDVLQWGRDLSAAEGRRLRCPSDMPSWLQWGRDLSAAEGRCSRSSTISQGSFNGAATFRPRKDAVSAAQNTRKATSFNGAATFRPRKVGAGASGRPWACCFNGAATFRPRKVGLRFIGRGCAPGFNGAATFRPRKVGVSNRVKSYGNMASMGPRPFGRGRESAAQPARGMVWLQWGRDLSAAEGRPAPRTHVSRRELQWGRDLSAAEGLLGGRKVCHYALLQWGRDLSAAEGGRASRWPSSRPPGFNGAATFRPRKE